MSLAEELLADLEEEDDDEDVPQDDEAGDNADDADVDEAMETDDNETNKRPKADTGGKVYPSLMHPKLV